MTKQYRQRMERRFAILKALKADPYPDLGAIADAHGVSYHTVRNLELRMRQEGAEAALHMKPTGRPKKAPPVVEKAALLLASLRRDRGLSMEEACDLHRGDTVVWTDPDDGSEQLIEVHSVTGIHHGMVEVNFNGGFMEADPGELRMPNTNDYLCRWFGPSLTRETIQALQSASETARAASEYATAQVADPGKQLSAQVKEALERIQASSRAMIGRTLKQEEQGFTNLAALASLGTGRKT
jgi:transposase